MVQAAESAAAAAQAAQAMLSRQTGDESRSWWELLPKPQVFDHSTRESEISSWKEWSLSFEQYIASVDGRFAEDIQNMRSHLDREVDPVDFSDSEKQRNTFLYSLLSSLVRQRALLVVRQTTGNNGLEAYRTLIQQNEPISKNRSMGLLNVIMNWPTFSGKLSLMQNVLKLEHAYAEYEKFGNRLNDDLKTAILMRSVTGQLKAWLQLQVTESTTYSRVREMVLMYDVSTTRWSEQMVLGMDSSGTTGDGPTPMEIDRVESKGNGKSGAKGKQKGKGDSKGKSKGKQKGKGDSKGKSKGYDQKGSKGNAGDRSKGKGKSDGKQCYICGRSGHFARECWQNQVRAMPQSSVAQTSDAGVPQQAPIQGSPSSSAGASFTYVSSASQHGHQVQQSGGQGTQYRVARIVENNDKDMVFDLTASSQCDGFLRVVHFHIGDDDDDMGGAEFPAGVRAVVEEVPDNSNLETILLDSGADASVFPISLVGAGEAISSQATKLQDAQGKPIPIDSMRLVEIKIPTSSGNSIVLKEKVAISSRVSQPILCFGHLLEQGFGIDGREQSLIHAAGGINIPLQMQNKSMAVLGHVRVLQAAPTVHGPQVVGMVKAEVEQTLINSPIGWSVNATGYIVGRHLSDSFQDPSLAFPGLQGPQCRTTIAKGDDGRWYILELNEPLRGIIQPDSKFHDMDSMRSVTTIVTEGEKFPDLMGFRFEGEGHGNDAFEVHENPGDAVLVAPEDEIQGAEIAVPEAAMEGRDVGEAQVIVRPAKDDEIVVNGVRLTEESSLAVQHFNIRWQEEGF